MKEYFKLSLERLKSTTPIYFKKIIRFGLLLGGIGLGLVLAGSLIPAILHTIGGYLLAVGITSAAIAKQTTTDKEITIKSDELLEKSKSSV